MNAAERPTATVDRSPAVSSTTGSLPAAPSRPWAGSARVALLSAADALALLLAGVVAYLLWALPVHGQDAALYIGVTPAIVLILLGYGQAGLYPGFGLGPVEVLRRYVLVTATAALVLAALIFGLKLQNEYSRVTLALAFVLSLCLIGSFRWLVTRWARGRSWWPEPAVVIADPDHSEAVRALLDGSASKEFRPVAVLPPAVIASADGDEGAGNPSSVEYVRSGVEIAFTSLKGPGSEEVIDTLRLTFPRVIVLREFRDLPVEGVQVRNLGGLLGLEYGNNLLRRQSRWVKRSLDIGIAVVALVVTTPLVVASMLAVKVISPGPALYRQEREGRRGETIRVPKIRTMAVDAEGRMEELLESDPGLREEWENGFKLKNDPRIVPLVGRLLRRFSIDELPQLWSVVRGEVSLVGPRPFPAYHLDALAPQARRLRAEVRPGLTGLWQVEARGLADVEVQQSYDVYYIRNWSVWLDLYILARTFGAVITGRGAY